MKISEQRRSEFQSSFCTITEEQNQILFSVIGKVYYILNYGTEQCADHMDPDPCHSFYVEANPDQLSNMKKIHAVSDLQHRYLGYHPDLNRC
jgi:hypothetical protein